MTTLHALRRTYALTFSEVALVTGVGTRQLAAFEYHGCPLSRDERHRVAAFFGLPDGTLEGGFVSCHIAEPTLSPTRARALVLTAAVMTLTWSLQNALAHEHAPLGGPLAAPIRIGVAHAEELQLTEPAASPTPESVSVIAQLLPPSAASQEPPTPEPTTAPQEPPTPEPTAASPTAAIIAAQSPLPSTATPLPTAVPPTVTPPPTAALTQPTVVPTKPAPSAYVSSDIRLPTPPGLPPEIIWTTQPTKPTASTPAPVVEPTPVTRAHLQDGYENNYDFDHAALISVNEPVSKLNFVCPDDSECADNDFFKVQLTGGDCYQVATSDLSSGIDTNLIVYGSEGNRRPALGGNDNAAPGELRSQVDVCIAGRGPKTGFILVGNQGNQRPPEPVAERTYTLKVTRLAAPPTPAGQPHRCPLEPERGSVIVVQGWGVGTHAPAAQWGGVDLIVQGAPTAGTPIVASHSGRVQVVLNSWPAGNYVSITSDTGWRTAYAHLSSVLVRNGDYVEAGTVIGTVGATGWATGPHLHYETWRHGVNVDPTPMLFCR